MNAFLFHLTRSLQPTFGLIEIAIIGVILALVVVAFFSSIRKNKTAPYQSNVLDRVSNNNRARIAPMKRLYDEIQTIVAQNRSNAAVSVIGTQTLQEADLILDQCVRMLGHREMIMKSGVDLNGITETSENLRAQAEGASSDVTRTRLESAATAYDIQSKQIEIAKKALSQIDAGLKEAEAALGLMKSRLSAAALGTDGPRDYDEEFRGSIMRLRSLSASLTEAQEMENDLKA